MTVDWNVEMQRIQELRRSRTRVGPGVRPAVVVVDFQRAFTEHEGCGPATRAALERTAELLAAARAAHVPVVYLRNAVDDLDDRMLAQKVRSSLTERCLKDDPWARISDVVAPAPGDTVVDKRCASGFYRTGLDDVLRGLGVDELVVAGTSTSGCVRATIVDASFRSYRISAVEECLDDFRPISGEVAKWDIQDRYGDVVPLAEVLARFEALAGAAVTA